MNNGDHIFIIHSDDGLWLRSPLAGQIVDAGTPGEDGQYEESHKERTTAEETERIRQRSAVLNNSISGNPDAPTHLWPDKARGLSARRLHFFVRCLAKSAPGPNGLNQLEAVGEMCCATWFLKCIKDPIANAAEDILLSAGTQADTKWLAIITFVLGRDEELRAHLENLVWYSSATLEIPIPCLRDWVHDSRKASLHRIYNYFHEEIRALKESHKDSKPISSIYDKLMSDSNGVGLGVNFWPGWLHHEENDGNVLKMSPQKLTDDVLSILRQEVGDDKAQIGARSGSTSNGIHGSNGPRSGSGGDWLKLYRIWKDSDAMAIRSIVRKVEDEKRNGWKRLGVEENKMDNLKQQRNEEQNKWVSGLLVPHLANGGPTQPEDSIEQG